jgi:integral membrane protein
MLRTPLSLFRTLAIAEAVSWTLLIAGLIVRATTGWAPAVTIGGGIHGFVFLSYGAAVVLVALNNRWPAGPTVVALISAIVPYATIPVELWVHRRGLLAGAWRVEADADAADARWYDGPLAWFLRRPWLLFVGILVAVVGVFAVLLILGPPGGAKG